MPRCHLILDINEKTLIRQAKTQHNKLFRGWSEPWQGKTQVPWKQGTGGRHGRPSFALDVAEDVSGPPSESRRSCPFREIIQAPFYLPGAKSECFN